MKSIKIKKTITLAILLLFSVNAFSQAPTPDPDFWPVPEEIPALPDRIDVNIVNLTYELTCGPTPDSICFDVQLRVGSGYYGANRIGAMNLKIDLFLEPGVTIEPGGTMQFKTPWGFTGGILQGPFPPFPYGWADAVEIKASRSNFSLSTPDFQTFVSVKIPITSTAKPTSASYMEIRVFNFQLGSYWGSPDNSTPAFAFTPSADKYFFGECPKPDLEMADIIDVCKTDVIDLEDYATVGYMCTPGDVTLTFYKANMGTVPPSPGVSIPSTPYTVGSEEMLFAKASYGGCDSIVPFMVSPPVAIPPTVNSAQQFCDKATVGDLNPTGSTIRWYDVPTGGIALSSITPLVDGDIYYASQIPGSGCESEQRSPVTVSILPPDLLDTPDIADQILCDDDATVDDIQTDGSSGIVFFDPNGDELAPGAPLTLPGTYRAIYLYGIGASTCESKDSTKFMITFTATAVAPAIDDQFFCEGATIANIVVPNNQIVWYADATTPVQLTPDTRLTSNIYYAAQSIGGTCGESTRVAVDITIGDSIPPPITHPPYELCNGTTLGGINVTGLGITWYENATGGPELPLTMEIPTGTWTFYAEQRSSSTCYSAERAMVEVTIENCDQLLECDSLPNRIVEERNPGDRMYEVQATDNWDIDPVTMATLDSARYVIDGTIYSRGISATLLGAIFPAGLSHVRVIAFSGTLTDSCDFTVFVERQCPVTTQASHTGEPYIYTVTKLAGTCWTSNIRATMYDDGTSDPINWAKLYNSSIYSDEAHHDSVFGRLYTWHSTVNQPAPSSSPSPGLGGRSRAGSVQGICPDGWHVPSTAEWNLLSVYNVNDLKSADPAHWLTPGSDIYGFDARPAGRYDSATGAFVDLYGFTAYWASDDTPGQSSYAFIIYYFCSDPEMTQITDLDGISVRCVID